MRLLNVLVGLLGILYSGVTADDFVCPTNKISVNDGVTGSIPSGATSMVQFNAGTNCIFKFDVPLGFAIRMVLNSAHDITKDDYVKFDNFHTPNANNQLEWYMGPELFVTVYSVTGNLTFFGEYTYVDVSSYTQVVKRTGDYFNTTMEPNKFYTIQGDAGSSVTYTLTQRPNLGGYDPTVREVFLFDGPDLINSAYGARLSEIPRTSLIPSTYNTLTFLNLYGSPSDSVILGNDFSTIYDLPQYNVVLMDPNTITTGVFHNRVVRDDDAYYTFICDGCPGFYIEGLTFVNRSAQASEGTGYVEVQGMTPSDDLPQVLNYSYSLTANLSLPQYIPASVATFHSYKSNVNFVMSTTAHTGYFNAQNGKIRSVSAPNLWNPEADAQFDYTFSDPVRMFNYSINLEMVKIVGVDDWLGVEVGSIDGEITLSQKYMKTSFSNVRMSGVGHYLHLKYSGSKQSQVMIGFEEIEMTGSTVTTAPTTAGPSTVSSTVPNTVYTTVPTTPLTSGPATTATTQAPSTVSSSTAQTTITVPTTVSTTVPTTVSTTVPSTATTSTAPITTTVPTTVSTTVSISSTSTSAPTTTVTTPAQSTVSTTTPSTSRPASTVTTPVPSTVSTSKAPITAVPTTVSTSVPPTSIPTTRPATASTGQPISSTPPVVTTPVIRTTTSGAHTSRLTDLSLLIPIILSIILTL